MPFIIYSALRLALIFILGVVLYAVGVRDLLLPLLAIVLALMVSYLVLGKQREAAAVYLAGRKKNREETGERFSRAVTDDAAFEDDQVDTVVGVPNAQGVPGAGAPAAHPGVSEPGAEPLAADAQRGADQDAPADQPTDQPTEQPAADQHPSDREP